MSATRSLFLSGLMAGAFAQSVQKVMVGQGGLKFVPNQLTASVGDQIEFYFVADDHSVVQGTFDNPCQPLSSSSFYSGFPDVSDTPFTITVNSTDPIWFYCSSSGHCQNGMVGVINAPSGETLSSYADAAMSVQKNGAPAQVQGGVFASATSAAPMSTSSAAMSSSSASSASMSSAMSMTSAAMSASSSMMSESSMMSSMMSSESSAMMTSMTGAASASATPSGSSTPEAQTGAAAATAAPLAGIGAAAGLFAAVAGLAL